MPKKTNATLYNYNHILHSPLVSDLDRAVYHFFACVGKQNNKSFSHIAIGTLQLLTAWNMKSLNIHDFHYFPLSVHYVRMLY
jgi:hypothetical protein